MPKRVTHYHPSQILIDGDIIRLRVACLTRDDLDQIEEEAELYGWIPSAGPADALKGPRNPIQRKEATAWLRKMMDWVDVEPGDFIVEGPGAGEEREIRTGRELLDRYAGRYDDVIPMLLSTLFAEQRLSEEAKKNLRSQLASLAGSNGAAPTAAVTAMPAAAGTRPDWTAAPVAPVGTTVSAGATEPNNSASSGMTVPSPSAPVPSEV